VRSSLRAFVREHRVAVAIALLVLVVVGPVVSFDTAQPASRLSLTAALVDHHSVDLGPYKDALDVDFARYQGHLRSDKAPGQPIFAIPAYVTARLVGAPSPTRLRFGRNLELWWLTFWSAMVPLAVLLALIYTECARFVRRTYAVAVTLLFGFGSMLLPFGANLFGHVLAALCGFGAWMLVNRGEPSARRAALAGLLAGCAVLIEYETAIVAVVLGGYLLVRHRRRVVTFAAGGVLPMLVLAWYQWRAFGAPWRTPSAFYAGVLNGTSKGGYTVPSLHDLWWIFGGDRGLWVGAPMAIIGLAAAVWFAVGAHDSTRTPAIVALAVMVPYVVLCAGWSGTALLVDPGPRYLIPALPFLAVPLALAWERVRVIAVPAAALGALIAFTATWSSLLSPQHELFTAYRYFWQHRVFGPTLWSMAFGRAGFVLYAATVTAAAAVLAHALQDRTDVRSRVEEPVR
jgi:hypothetical protein